MTVSIAAPTRPPSRAATTNAQGSSTVESANLAQNTCRRLRQECLPYLLENTTLRVASTPEKAYLLPTAYLPSIPKAVILNVESYFRKPLDLARLTSLRTLELRNIAVWCQYHDEEYLLGEDGEEVMLNLAKFNLRRISIPIHQLCSSKDRTFNILLHCRYVVTSATQETLVSSFPRCVCETHSSGRRHRY